MPSNVQCDSNTSELLTVALMESWLQQLEEMNHTEVYNLEIMSAL